MLIVTVVGLLVILLIFVIAFAHGVGIQERGIHRQHEFGGG